MKIIFLLLLVISFGTLSVSDSLFIENMKRDVKEMNTLTQKGLSVLLFFNTYYGVSVRTPNITPNDLDYEISFGLEKKFRDALILIPVIESDLWLWYERENGKIYKGADGDLTIKMDIFEDNIFGTYREAQDIERVGLSTGLRVYFFSFGSGITWDHDQPVWIGYSKISNKYLTFNMNFYKEGIESASLNLKKEYSITKYISLIPMVKYSIDRKKKEFIQSKIVLKIKK